MHDWADLLSDWPGDESLLSYNVAPTNVVPIVAAGGVKAAQWGMIPSWAKEFKMQYATFNARIETVGEKASFKNAWRKGQTCLVPVGGYYEWMTENGNKQPYVVHHPEQDMLLAGLWERWNDRLSFTVLTEEAQGELKTLHPRMPLFIAAESALAWLDGDYTVGSSVDSNLTRFYKVNKRVGNSRNEGADLIEPEG